MMAAVQGSIRGLETAPKFAYSRKGRPLCRLIVMYSCIALTRGFLVPAPRGSSALHSVPFREFARTEGKAASADPGAEFMRHGKGSSSEGAGNSTATRSRSKLPPMKETMQ